MLGTAAAFRLRWLEARRRGGLWLVLGTALLVFWVAWRGGDSVGGRFGFAGDIAGLFTFALAIFFGAFPLAVDRERRRAYLASASPASPLGWTFGNVLGAAATAALAGFFLHGAAAAGAAAGGGIETFEMTRIGSAARTLWLPDAPRRIRIEVPADAHSLRARPVVYARVAEEGSSGRASVFVGQDEVEIVHERPWTTSITPPFVELGSADPAFAVGVPLASIRALGAPRSFLANALRAAVAPAIVAAGVAALAVAAAAHLTAGVAALTVIVLVLLGALKPFVLDSLAEERGAIAAAPGAAAAADRAPAAARAFVKGALFVVPDLTRANLRARVIAGEWLRGRAWRHPAVMTGICLILGTLLGAWGVHRRRTT